MSSSSGGAAPSGGAAAAEAPKEEEKKEEEKVQFLVDLPENYLLMRPLLFRRSLTTTWASVSLTKRNFVSLQSLRVLDMTVAFSFGASCVCSFVSLTPTKHDCMSTECLIVCS